MTSHLATYPLNILNQLLVISEILSEALGSVRRGHAKTPVSLVNIALLAGFKPQISPELLASMWSF